MNKAVIILTLIFSLTAGHNAFATEKTAETTVFSADNYISSQNTKGTLVFLFSSAAINNSHNGDIWLLFSTAELNADISGNIYMFSSEATLTPGASLLGGIKTLSSQVKLPAFFNTAITSFDGWPGVFRRESETGGMITIDDRISNLNIYLSAATIAFSYLALAAKKSVIEQGAMSICKEPQVLMRNGVVLYFGLLALAVLFAATLFLVPLTLILAVIFCAVTVIGEASVSLVVGHSAAGLAGLKLNAAACLFAGALLVETIRNIPYLGWGFNYLFFPILACGTAANILINAVTKKYYEPIFHRGRF